MGVCVCVRVWSWQKWFESIEYDSLRDAEARQLQEFNSPVHAKWPKRGGKCQAKPRRTVTRLYANILARNIKLPNIFSAP